ncbi:MAG: hypothetical protein ABIJ56_03250 [Pseudomonadota bacterium]
MTAAAVCLLFALTAVSGSSPDIEKTYKVKVQQLKQAGIEDIAPGELETARGLFEAYGKEEREGGGLAKRYQKLLDLQLKFLEEAGRVSAAQEEVRQLEKEANEALKAMKTEKAAYEYFIDQTLASGLVSQWATP